MQNDKFKSYLNLHMIVFMGFTAVLGALITITADAIVWYRMLLAAVFLSAFIVFKKSRFDLQGRFVVLQGLIACTGSFLCHMFL
jgi:Na+(H+)/acetate symporter ActP